MPWNLQCDWPKYLSWLQMLVFLESWEGRVLNIENTMKY
jgi:hypothetical protein